DELHLRPEPDGSELCDGLRQKPAEAPASSFLVAPGERTVPRGPARCRVRWPQLEHPRPVCEGGRSERLQAAEMLRGPQRSLERERDHDQLERAARLALRVPRRAGPQSSAAQGELASG